MFKETPILPYNTSLATLRELVAQHDQLKSEDMQFNLLMITCGLPRSGKSTWSRHHGIPIVDPDAIRLAFQGRPYMKETEEWIWSITRVMVKSLFYAGHRDVIVGGCNTALRHRSQWSDSSGLWRRLICVFDTSMDTCLQRAKDNVRLDLLHVIRNMDAHFEHPQPFEGAIVILRF